MLNKTFSCALAAAAAMLALPATGHAAAKVAVGALVPMDIHASAGFTYKKLPPPAISPEPWEPAAPEAGLDVTTAGYLLCTDVERQHVSKIEFRPHRAGWTMPVARDVQAMNYKTGLLQVNQDPAGGDLVLSSVVCHQRAADGRLLSGPFSRWADPIFGHDFDRHPALGLINWHTPDSPEWKAAVVLGDNTIPGAPTDACNFDPPFTIRGDGSSGEHPQLAEPVLCAAATGVKAAPDRPHGVRASTMWTHLAMDSNNRPTHFVYLARIDARVGDAGLGPDEAFTAGSSVPSGAVPPEDGAIFEVRDAFHGAGTGEAATGILKAEGSWCKLKALPQELDVHVCDDPALRSGSKHELEAGSALTTRLMLHYGRAESFYVAVIRPFVNGSSIPQPGQPIAAMAIFAPGFMSRDFQGNQFTGDDVIFGFYGEQETFPWAEGTNP